MFRFEILRQKCRGTGLTCSDSLGQLYLDYKGDFLWEMYATEKTLN